MIENVAPGQDARHAARSSWTTRRCARTTRQFRKYLPRVQVYYAVKANSDPAIVQTFYEAGASFDVASVAEFLTRPRERSSICRPSSGRTSSGTASSTPTRSRPSRRSSSWIPYKPLVTYDNHEEVIKIARHAPHAGLVLRLRVPNTGSMVELSSKFGALPGEAVDLIAFAHNNKLEVEGLSFHVGSQCTNFAELRPGPAPGRGHLRRGEDARLRPQAARHRRRLSRPLRRHRPAVQEPGPNDQRGARPALSQADRDSRRAGAVSRRLRRHRRRQDHRQGRPRRQALLLHQRRRLPHLQRRDLRPLPVPPQELQERSDPDLLRLRPDLRRPGHHQPGRATARPGPRRLLYSENIGAYSAASSTYFNGFPPAKVVHVNQ